MAEYTSLESLQALYADLYALSERRLSSIERLGAQLDAHMKDFRGLLDKKPRNDQSRKILGTGRVKVYEIEYKINEEFQREVQQLADELDLDELDATRIFLEAQTDPTALGQSTHTNSLILFHQRRKYLLDCLQTICLISADPDLEDVLRDDILSILGQVVLPEAGSQTYTQRCLLSMNDIRIWLRRLADKLNGASVIGQLNSETLEAVEYQRVSLIKQHESLSTILFYLIKENFSDVNDLHVILDFLRKADKYDNLLVHYIPALSACVSRYGSTDAAGGIIDARALHEKLLGQDSEENPWTLAFIRAAFHVIWLSEYSGWYIETSEDNLMNSNLHDETKKQSKQFNEALKDGAFDFLLSVSADVKSVEWYDPARHGLRQWLQRKSPVILADSVPFSEIFQKILTEQLEAFVESFITNLPDVLRKLRVDEDEQRQLSKDHDHDLDLERFIMIISYTFEGRPKASFEGFWDVPDGALLGFVYWASRRASTPLVSAFCEMLQSISEDEECATAAHQFLLDEGIQATGKTRRMYSLTWNQIFKELTYFSGKIRDNPVPLHCQNSRSSTHGSILEAEPESVMMLECYLRLITRLCSESESARSFIIYHPSFNLTELLFQLASSAVGPRLRANAFTTLRSLLSHKTREVGEYIWNSLDIWASGGYSSGSIMLKSTSNIKFRSKNSILSGLASGFEEPNSFVQLLHALMLPPVDDVGLNDSLPFPEHLGITTRRPGINPYIDFAIGQVFGRMAKDMDNLDIIQRRLINLTCLNFILTCLETFNENLIIFHSQGIVPVNSVIQASSLENYVLLHPFSRVMEWVFNQQIMNALFSAVCQDPAEVARAEPDSPLVLCLLRGIRVMTLILELQATYLEIIRPLLRSHPEYRRLPVSNTSLAYFEDGVLNHLVIFPTLGRYCGTGHPDLIIFSLKLLEKLSSSPLLAPPRDTLSGYSKNRALAAIDDDSEAVSKILLREMEAEIDINQGPKSCAYIIKLQILDFILSCLRASPNQSTIAHLLLGFRCGQEGLFIDPQSSFNLGFSLFHTILNLVLGLPVGDETDIIPWLVTLHYKALQVLKELWVSPLSSSITTAQMRAHDFFFIMFIKEQVIQPKLTWNGLSIGDTAFSSSQGSVCFSEYLGRRAILFQYYLTELRQLSQIHSPSLKQRILETLMGSTKIEDEQLVDHVNIFDFFDFLSSGVEVPRRLPQVSWLSDTDISACFALQTDPLSSHNSTKLEEFLALKISELRKTKQLENSQDIALVNLQSQELIDYYSQEYRLKMLSICRHQALISWVQLILIIIEKANFDDISKTSFVSRALQTIIPRLESNTDLVETTELARLAKSLLFSLDFDAECFKQKDIAELVSDRIFHLFQISLHEITTLGPKVSLKEWYYNICFWYLSCMLDLPQSSGLLHRFSFHIVRSSGDKLIDVVCDDASNGEPMCKTSALLLLICFVKIEKKENPKYVINSLIRLNFIGLLVESIRNISRELRDMPSQDVDLHISCCLSKLALLQEIAQTRPGATAVCNSGLFRAIEESDLFLIDPDLGVDIKGPGAVGKHYGLVAAVIRIVCTTVLSRGSQNHQILHHVRQFLANNRLSIFSILKKSVGVGVANDTPPHTIEDLADLYLFLISFTGFCENGLDLN